MKKDILINLITYIRDVKLNDLILRKNIIKFGTSVDNYRNYLTHANYLEIVSPGVYRYVKIIPKNMTYGRLVKEAYPTSYWTSKYKYIPENLYDAIDILVKSNKDNNRISKNENEFLCEAHFHFGKFLRNEWGLWTGSVLQSWFKEQGIHHPDDMSSIILISFHRTLFNKSIELENQIKDYCNHQKFLVPRINTEELE